VDERVFDFTRFAVAGQQAVTVMEQLFPVEQRFAKIVSGVVIMMKMDFDFPKARATELRELIDLARPVHLDWIEECVPGRTTIVVSKAPEQPGILLNPIQNPTVSLHGADIAIARFKVITNA